jgi:uncharacterized protein (DUF4415 family)
MSKVARNIRSKPAKKKIPVSIDADLYEWLMDIKKQTGRGRSTTINMVLRARKRSFKRLTK